MKIKPSSCYILYDYIPIVYQGYANNLMGWVNKQNCKFLIFYHYLLLLMKFWITLRFWKTNQLMTSYLFFFNFWHNLVKMQWTQCNPHYPGSGFLWRSGSDTLPLSVKRSKLGPIRIRAYFQWSDPDLVVLNGQIRIVFREPVIFSLTARSGSTSLESAGTGTGTLNERLSNYLDIGLHLQAVFLVEFHWLV